MATLFAKLRALDAPPTFTIDKENPADIVAREALLDRAMGPERHLKSSEILRRGRMPADGLALVARDEAGHLIGTVRLWKVEAGIARNGQPLDALLLGPLAVAPEHGGKGIGSALMRAAITEAKSRGHGAILLVGDAEYYARFGFSKALAETFVMPGPFARERFLALELKEGWLAGAAGMLVASGAWLQEVRRRRAA